MSTTASSTTWKRDREKDQFKITIVERRGKKRTSQKG